jgi:mannosylglycerate hydrolase
MPHLVFHLIPHTHWDREWYLPRGRFGARLVPVIDDLIDLLVRNPAIPGFLLDGQTVLLEDYLRVRPEMTETVGRLVRTGRIETGPWYVLPDEQIPSGESMIRNLLLGKADTERWGAGMKVMYSPDAFGHPAIWPTLACEFGIESGVAWRGITGPWDLLRWFGPDGQGVTLYHLPPDGYEVGSAISSDPGRIAETWAPVRRTLVARSAGRHIAVFVGADHHAARPDLGRLRELIARLEPEHEVRLSRLGDFMQAVRETDGLPEIEGEQRSHGYTWALQGVHGTRAHHKRRNSRVELWLERYAEPLAALAARNAGRDRRPLLGWAWRTLVQCHFHDAIGGCASDAVAAELETRFTEAEGVAREITQGSVQDLWKLDPDRARDFPEEVRPSLLIWNPAPRTRKGIVLAEVTRFSRDVLVGPPGNRIPRAAEPGGRFSFRTEAGKTIPVQVMETVAALERLDAAGHYPDQDEVELVRVALEGPLVEGLAGSVLAPVPGGEEVVSGELEVTDRRLTNGHVEVEVADDGSLTLTVRHSGLLMEGQLRLESEADLGDTYSFAPADPPRVTRFVGPVSVRTLARGPLVAALEVRGNFEGPTHRTGRPNGLIEVNILIMLLRDDPVVRCTIRLDNHATDHRLRARFPTGQAVSCVTAGAQFGSIVRSTLVPEPAEWGNEAPVATAPAHRYIGVGGLAGLAVLAPGFFEYEMTPGGDLAFTLLRSVGQLSRNDLATRPGHAGWPTPTPMAQCPGRHALEIAIAVGPWKWDDPVELHQAWEDVFLPLKAAWYRDWNGSDSLRSSGEREYGGIELVGEGLVLSSVKPGAADRTIVLRCYNLTDDPVGGIWRLGFEVARAYLAGADETIMDELPRTDAGRSVRFTAGAQAIVTIVVA